MHLGLHLPQLDFDGSGLSLSRLTNAARAARDTGFGSLGANDHVLFAGPWLDGLTALTAVVESSGDLELVTSVAVPALRHPLLLAKGLVALDVLSEGRVVAGIGPGSSNADYDAVGIDFAERWQRLDEAARLLRHVLRGAPLTGRRRPLGGHRVGAGRSGCGYRGSAPPGDGSPPAVRWETSRSSTVPSLRRRHRNPVQNMSSPAGPIGSGRNRRSETSGPSRYPSVTPAPPTESHPLSPAGTGRRSSSRT